MGPPVSNTTLMSGRSSWTTAHEKRHPNTAMAMSLIASTRGLAPMPANAKNLLALSVGSRPLEGKAPTIDAAVATASPTPRRFQNCSCHVSESAFAAGATPSLAAIFTRSARESALIFRITWPRCAFTVISLIPSSPPTCLFSKPETTSAMTSRSRGLSDS